MALLTIGVLIASLAGCGAISLYLSVRPEEGQVYARAQYLIAAFLLCSLLLDVGLAWILGYSQRVPRFVLRLLFSLGTTLAGAICIFVGTALIARWIR